MEGRVSKTRRNLWIAFIEEAKANRLYTAYAQRAREEGHEKAAEVFEKVAADEERHALNHLKALGAIRSTAENLAEVIAEESAEAAGAFPRMIEQVRREGNPAAEESLRIALEDSLGHVKLFEEALASVGGEKTSIPSPSPLPATRGEVGEIASEKPRIARLERIREVVFGAQDGLISTMAVGATVMLATGARIPTVVAALASALAGTVSMATGTYLGSQSEKELHEAEIQKESEELATKPEEEVAELLQVLRQEGYSYEEALRIAERVESDPALMLKTLAEKELGLAVEGRPESPLFDALTMAGSFFAASLFATAPYLLLQGRAAVAASIASCLLALFGIGALKTRVTRRNPWLSGLEVFGVGVLSAALSFLLGDVLPRLLVGG